MALGIGLMDDGIAVFVELPHFLLGTEQAPGGGAPDRASSGGDGARRPGGTMLT